MTTVLGIDEAGRGPVIGPLVICGYLLNENKVDKLTSIGVKDSKMFSPLARAKLDKKLRRIADDYVIITINAPDIDRLRSVHNLNKIEVRCMRKIINLLDPDKVVIDAVERNTNKFLSKLNCRKHGLIKFTGADKKRQIIAENFADKNFPIVGAASIVAKVERDKAVEKIKKEIGIDFGSGYTSDPRTIKFLNNWVEKNNRFPDCVRQSWITARLLLEQRSQMKLNALSNYFDEDRIKAK